ncbi:hypothetical protein [Rhodococcus sp. NCIMB 12038]
MRTRQAAAVRACQGGHWVLFATVANGFPGLPTRTTPVASKRN